MSEGIASILATSSDTAHLRRLADRGDEQTNTKVLQQFEALFLQQMLKNMRTASLGNGLFQSDQTEFYRDMYDQQIATELANKEVLGISQLINRQLGLTQAPLNESSAQRINQAPKAEFGIPVETEKVQHVTQANIPLASIEKSRYFEPAIPAAKSIIDGLQEIRLEPVKHEPKPFAFKPDSPEDFVDYAYQYAIAPAKRLGVNANVILAIAALETGWGTQLPTEGNKLSNNYFGIKADSRWSGDKIDSETLEFEEGMFNRLKQSFRVYQNLEDSFNDFAEFILGNERYDKAVLSAGDEKSFLQEIQRAGYATDPQYADKVLDVLRNNVFSKFRN